MMQNFDLFKSFVRRTYCLVQLNHEGKGILATKSNPLVFCTRTPLLSEGLLVCSYYAVGDTSSLPVGC